jgi:hypothetical protein
MKIGIRFLSASAPKIRVNELSFDGSIVGQEVVRIANVVFKILS